MAVTEQVSTEFNLRGAQRYISGLGGIGGALGKVGGLISSVTSRINPLNIAIGALASGFAVHKVAQWNSEFENTKNIMAGMLQALEFTPDFVGGLEVARDVVEQIEIAAAKLPGEAEDYITVFKRGLPFVAEAFPGKDLQQLTQFTNDYTAVMASLSVNTEEATLGLQKMVAAQGMVDNRNRAFQNILPIMRQVEGATNITAQSFNKLTQTERAELLTKTLAKMGDTVEAASNTWDAISGAFSSTVQMMTRKMTPQLFEGMKTGLDNINKLFFDAEGRTTKFADAVIAVSNVVGGVLGRGLTRATEMMGALADRIGAMMGGGGDLVSGISRVRGELDNVLNILHPLVAAMQGAIDTVLSTAQSLYQPLIDALGPVVDVVTRLWTVFRTLQVLVVSALMPMFGNLLGSVINLVGGIAKVLSPVVMFLGGLLLEMWRVIDQHVLPIFRSLVDMITKVINFIAEGLSFFGKDLGEFYAGFGQDAESAARDRTQLSFFEDLKRQLREQTEAAKQQKSTLAGLRPPGQRATAAVTQDFRYSRFTIEQKFEEGFDPDRLAVAFSDDLARVAEKRLQSGFSPIFAVR